MLLTSNKSDDSHKKGIDKLKKENEFLKKRVKSLENTIQGNRRKSDSESVGFKAQERKLRKNIDHLSEDPVETEKFTAIGRMASVIAHEIRNPLNSILAIVEYQKSKLGDIKMVQEHARIIHEEVSRLNKFAKDCLEFCKPVKLQLCKFQFNDLVKETISLISPLIVNKNINVEISVDLDENLPKILIDPQRMKEIVINIMQNAVKTIENKQAKSTDKNTITLMTRYKVGVSENYLEFVCKDSGCGIKKKDRENILKPFYTTSRDGVGLGLAIVDEIIKKHNGSIQIDSKKGEGTTFRISVPYSENKNRK